ncbi:helix-turn-helix domain-containing protein [Mucilaginibacter psychrotolerans]|uniref:Helix-turn-helix domain-containing protein n=1 Tax=Mucilaginibacter psychrotolerans TaxID=1524096 RepID=A0A4Y8RYV7_9SPHI|nr:helix-turn-helix domain-containing protein [Mucilaginibacter psychrotolerans]TFF29713.1 helix-turn-helix domain-containing protein [Mucilaginibacter psychrotolerans]
MVRKEKVHKKHEIISEYLTGTETFVALSSKYGVNARTIQTWVRKFREQEPTVDNLSVEERETDIRVLQKQLEEAKLKSELLEEMLRLSEEHTGINLRKKFGLKQ